MAMILKYYGNNFKISGPLHTVPLEWFRPVPATYSKKLLRVVDDESYRRRLLRRSFISCVTFLLVLFQGIQVSFKNTTDPLQTLILLWLLILILTTCVIYHHVCTTKSGKIAELLNAFIQFDKMYPKIERKFLDLPIKRILGTIMAKLIFLAEVGFPFAVVIGFHWNDPWKPSLVGFWLIPKLSNQSGTLSESRDFRIKLIVLAYNYWFWSFLVATR